MALALKKHPGFCKPKPKSFWMHLRDNYHLYLLVLPAIVLIFLFAYLPMFGLAIAFQKYHPYTGIWNSPWVGLGNFTFLFDEKFWHVFKNTLVITSLRLLFGFPAPIMLALIFNEIRHDKFKRIVQSAIYLPHFISWVIFWGLIQTMLYVDSGIINDLLSALGFERIHFLADVRWFYPLAIGTAILKELGWGTIIYLAALAGIDQELYESANLDGAGRWAQIWYITLPCMIPTISILLVLSIPGLLSAGFDQMYLMMNASNREYSEVLDTYLVLKGLSNQQYGLAAAMGLFNGIISTTLVIVCNTVSKRLGGQGIY